MTTENEQFNRQKPSEDHESGKAPWNAKFGSDENLKQRKYSRSSRNLPAREASTLSKVLLAVLVLTLFTPFVLYMLVKSSMDNTPSPQKTAESIMVSRNSETSTTTSMLTTVSGNLVSGEGTVSSVNLVPNQTTTVPTQPVVTEAPAPVTQAPLQATHTVSAGETWYGIARTYGVDVEALAAANGTNTTAPIHPGDVLIIP